MHLINPKYITIKKAIRKANLADAFICARYGFSPYHACEHGCIYCDGRAEKYYIKGEFDKGIVIRQNLRLSTDLFGEFDDSNGNG